MTLERSYHVATQDYDKELIFDASVEFARKVDRQLMLASIPSPSTGSIEIGPLSIHAYGLMIALGVVAAVWLAGRRLEQAGIGTREDIQAIAIWAVLAGIIGARLYHVVTDKSEPWRDPVKALQIWNGGLGIPGGAAGRHPRRAVAGQAPRPVDARRRRRRRPGAAARPGDRAARQLVEPGAVRQPDDAAVGAGDRPGAPHPERRHLSRRHAVPPDVPVRGAVEPRRCASC